MRDPLEIPAPLMKRMEEAVLCEGSGRRTDGEATSTVPASRLSIDFAALEPGSLATAGLACLRQALAAGDDRRGAFALLTADALITAACGAAATDGVPAALSAAHFAALLEAR